MDATQELPKAEGAFELSHNISLEQEPATGAATNQSEIDGNQTSSTVMDEDRGGSQPPPSFHPDESTMRPGPADVHKAPSARPSFSSLSSIDSLFAEIRRQKGDYSVLLEEADKSVDDDDDDIMSTSTTAIIASVFTGLDVEDRHKFGTSEYYRLLAQRHMNASKTRRKNVEIQNLGNTRARWQKVLCMATMDLDYHARKVEDAYDELEKNETTSQEQINRTHAMLKEISNAMILKFGLTLVDSMLRKRQKMYERKRKCSDYTSSLNTFGTRLPRRPINVELENVVAEPEKGDEVEEVQEAGIKIRRKQTQPSDNVRSVFLTAMISALRKYGVDILRWLRIIIWKLFTFRWRLLKYRLRQLWEWLQE